MSATNFVASLAFVWGKGFDNPGDGYHVTPGDPGGGTFGGVTEATWAAAVKAGIVQGTLRQATTAQLSAVLRALFWTETCDALPDGLDLVLFNGRMMTGAYPKLVQQCLGFMGLDEVDGWLGPVSLKAACAADPATLINAVSGAHYAYLAGLSTWRQFGSGWSKRLVAAQAAALAMVQAGKPVA